MIAGSEGGDAEVRHESGFYRLGLNHYYRKTFDCHS